MFFEENKEKRLKILIVENKNDVLKRIGSNLSENNVKNAKKLVFNSSLHLIGYIIESPIDNNEYCLYDLNDMLLSKSQNENYFNRIPIERYIGRNTNVITLKTIKAMSSREELYIYTKLQYIINSHKKEIKVKYNINIEKEFETMINVIDYREIDFQHIVDFLTLCYQSLSFDLISDKYITYKIKQKDVEVKKMKDNSLMISIRNIKK
jgi:hypothetical protein